jgi:dolichol-phosphate mannosyltransferase
MYARILLRLKLNDATSGFRAYRSTIIQKIHIKDVRADGYGFQIEMAYRTSRAGAVVKEVPITFIDRVEGVSKMSSRIIVEALLLVTMWGVRDGVRKVVGLGKARP